MREKAVEAMQLILATEVRVATEREVRALVHMPLPIYAFASITVIAAAVVWAGTCGIMCYVKLVAPSTSACAPCVIACQEERSLT